MRRTYYLVRHGETEWNAARRMQGQWDSRLSESGRAHARQTGLFLSGLAVDAVYSSPLGRVRETLSVAGAHFDFPPVEDDRLKEWSSGEWSGYFYSEIKELWPEEFAQWKTDMLNVRPRGGENFSDLLRRGRSFLRDLESQQKNTVAIVAHGFINRALAAILLNLDAEEMLSLRQTNDAIFRICINDAGTEAHHFIAGQGPYAGLPADRGFTRFISP